MSKGGIFQGSKSDIEFRPITTCQVERCRFKWVGYAIAALRYHQI